MELRNRRLSQDSENGNPTQTSQQIDDDMDQKASQTSGSDDEMFETAAGLEMDVDEHSEMDLGGEAFLGDFEEIEEDEDVERFISKNNTPTVSTRQSPEIHKDGSQSSDEDDIFEEISEHDGTAKQVEGDKAEQSASKADSEFGWYMANEDLERLRALQSSFRQNNVPKLDDGLFLCPDVYRRYSVLPTASASDEPALKTNDPAPTTTDSAPAKNAVTQKPSSLRSSGRIEAKSLIKPNTSAEAAPADASGATKHTDKTVNGGADDVVGTLLGAMSSPKSRVQEQTALAAIPSDMMAAMMAIEGGSTAPKSAQIMPENLAHMMAQRLPKGYKGPFSQLTAIEHTQYLQLAQRAKTGALVGKEHSDYTRLKARVDIEQQQFRERAREQAQARVRLIQDEINSSTSQELTRLGQRVLQSYPRQYRSAKVRTIRPSAARYTPLEYRETLFQRGMCGHILDTTQRTQLSAPDAWADGPLLSQDTEAMAVAIKANADVVLTDTALAALLSLPQSYMRDVIVPFTVREGARPMVVVDELVVPTHAATPRVLNEMYYSAAVRSELVDASRTLDLAKPAEATNPESTISSPEEPKPESNLANATYTLWELGGQRIVVRYAVHAFAQPAATVTLAVKVETQVGSAAAEAALASNGRDALEETAERERQAWWLAAYLRGSAAEVRVVHVTPDGSVVKTTRHTAADMYTDSQPPTRAVADLLQDLAQLGAGQYLLAHRRRTWDATVYRATDGVVTARSDAVLDLAAELAPVAMVDAKRAEVEGDVVTVAWHGMPGHIPHTYAPADLEPFCGAASTWSGGPSAAARGRRKKKPKRKGAKKA
ncbi:hypothetical protein IWW55_002723 [Coemansia sp. RSA 2706]|nr:hypothetical protein IWW55_002723 [Coemansia sp. RSA 2706]KAJ2728983.1 hypothetical protein H4R23_003552 [Coemansia sp. Cherry 401B]